MTHAGITAAVERYYAEAVRRHGPTPQGADWNSAASQRLRFDQLLRACDGSAGESVLDFGCGYGALVDVLVERRSPFAYVGYDISEAMIAEARARHGGRADCRFTTDFTSVAPADVAVASGVFHVRLGVAAPEWADHVRASLDQLAALSRRAFSFNLLTRHVTPGRGEARLFYADPAEFFEYCRSRFSRRVALLHDSPLYEFTIIVRHDA